MLHLKAWRIFITLVISLILPAIGGCATNKGTQPDTIPEGTVLKVEFKKNGTLVVVGEDGKKLKSRKINRNDPIDTKTLLGIRTYTLIVRENECTIDYCEDGACYSYVVSPGPCPPGLFD